MKDRYIHIYGKLLNLRCVAQLSVIYLKMFTTPKERGRHMCLFYFFELNFASLNVEGLAETELTVSRTTTVKTYFT